jgi:hypothetical protein
MQIHQTMNVECLLDFLHIGEITLDKPTVEIELRTSADVPPLPIARALILSKTVQPAGCANQENFVTAEASSFFV